MFAELIGGLLSNSLALLADAGHMLSDVGALALALFALWIARRPPNSRRTYGYARTEILAALVNGATLVGISLYIFVEAFGRLRAPPPVQGAVVAGIAAGGLLINLTALFTGLPRPLIMDLQDFVGQSSGNHPPSSAVSWINYLKANFGSLLAAVEINVEQFTITSGGAIVAGDNAELLARVIYYQGQGVTVGPSWEIRYWYTRLH